MSTCLTAHLLPVDLRDSRRPVNLQRGRWIGGGNPDVSPTAVGGGGCHQLPGVPQWILAAQMGVSGEGPQHVGTGLDGLAQALPVFVGRDAATAAAGADEVQSVVDSGTMRPVRRRNARHTHHLF